MSGGHRPKSLPGRMRGWDNAAPGVCEGQRVSALGPRVVRRRGSAPGRAWSGERHDASGASDGPPLSLLGTLMQAGLLTVPLLACWAH